MPKGQAGQVCFNPALNIFLYSHLKAEARLAAKRAARAEARSIRLKELERQQQEGENVCLWSHTFLLLQTVDICTFIVCSFILNLFWVCTKINPPFYMSLFWSKLPDRVIALNLKFLVKYV